MTESEAIKKLMEFFEEMNALYIQASAETNKFTRNLHLELEDLKQDVHLAVEEAYQKGLKEGITRYAWWKDGTQYVGTCGETLQKALETSSK